MENKEIKCADCGEMFDFSIGEQKFYQEKEFSNPKRCKECRRIRKEKREDGELGGNQ